MPQAIKTRFAPSPTGRLHLGNIRTALFNWLLARKHQGVFLLRFEDTDLDRSAQAFEEGMLQDLAWLGLQWDEGPGADDQSNGPYRQSQRMTIYETYYERLEQDGRAYPCFCTSQELKLSRKAQLSAGRPPRYAGTCAHLSGSEVKERRARGLRATLRFRVDDAARIEFEDLVRGPQRFAGADIGDFVIRRSDGMPAFFFSNAVDDALMQVTHVVRGEDHLTNTPRQLLLLKALELNAPQYGHASMLVADDGSPLSKRGGSIAVEELRNRGVLPRAVNNYLARLGHHYAEEGWLEPDALAAGFEFAHMGKSPARFQDAQLMHWQNEAVHRLDADSLWRWAEAGGDGTALERRVPPQQRQAFLLAVGGNVLTPGEVSDWAQRIFGEQFAYSDTAQQALAEVTPGFFASAYALVDEHGDDFKTFSRALSARTDTKGRGLFMPLRAALTGVTHGPELAQLWALLGKARIAQRFEAAARLQTAAQSGC